MSSECCDAPLLHEHDGLGICSECKEWSSEINEEDDDE